MIPQGVNYWFISSGDENLVMARVGARHHEGRITRAFPDGSPFDGSSEANKQVEIIVRPGPGVRRRVRTYPRPEGSRARGLTSST